MFARRKLGVPVAAGCYDQRGDLFPRLEKMMILGLGALGLGALGLMILGLMILGLMILGLTILGLMILGHATDDVTPRFGLNLPITSAE